MTIRNITKSVLLGGAYFTVVLQWLWVALIAVPPLIESGALDALTNPRPSETQAIQPDTIEMNGPIVWVVGAVTVCMLALTIFILIKIPKTVLHAGDTIVHKTSDAVIPIVTNHATLPAKKRRELSRRLVLMIQLAASILPAIISVFLPAVDELTKEIIITMALCMVIISSVGFTLAWLVEPQQKPTSRTRSHASRG